MQNGQCGFRLATKSVLQNLGQSRLPFRYPARIVLAHGLFIIAEQVGHISDRHATLQPQGGSHAEPPSATRRAASAHAVSSTASCPAIRIPPSFLFDRVQQLPAGPLATAASLGAHPAVLMHPGMPFALVAAALTYRRANPEERLGNYGVVVRLATLGPRR